MKTIIGEQIRRLREIRKITQEEIAVKLGMSRQRFARIEKGISDISYDVIVAVADILGVETKQITDVCENNPSVAFRMGNVSTGTFNQVEEMIGFFYANKSVYKRMSAENNDEL